MYKILLGVSTLWILAACDASSPSASAEEPESVEANTDIVGEWAATQSPSQSDSQMTNDLHAQSSSQPPVADMIAGLEQRLAANPNDLKGWTLLATSYAYVGQMSDARRAKMKAVELGADAEQLERQIIDAHDGPQF
ncbi:MAG: hypothetical protein OER97_06000 [Gammaproteobacteria bacterium]|nr:hypothetical protein [Gammaproteobacteria bacterium]